MKKITVLTFLYILSFPLFAQNSGSWVPQNPSQGDSIIIICDPSQDSQTQNLTISGMNLYWGVNGNPGNWKKPPQDLWPSGTTADGGQAVTSPMTKVGNQWQIKIKTNDQISNIIFLFRANSNSIWLRDNGQDFDIKLRGLPQSFTKYEILNSSVRVFAQTYFLSVSGIKDNILKVSFDDSVSVSTGMMVENLQQNLPAVISNDDSLLILGSGNINMHIKKSDMSVSFTDGSGKILVGSENLFQRTGAVRTVGFDIGDEALYGMGEKGTDLNRRGLVFDTYNRANYGYNSALSTMKINIPFLTTTGGYAVFFDNEYPADVDLRNQIQYAARGGYMTYYVIAGDLKEQLKGYHELTGYQPMPPKWAFGFIQSKYGYKSETEVKNIANTFRSLKIPADAIVLDLYWFGVESNMGNLAWNTSLFPNPTQFVSDLKNLGFKIIPIQETYLTTSSRLYTSFTAEGLTGKTANGANYDIGGFWAGTAALVDLTNPAAQQKWWQESKAINQTGIGGWWTDLGEPENHPGNMVHFGGSTEKVHNTYNLIWAKTLFEGFKQDFADKRFFNLTRSGTAGMQRYSTFPWSGDVERSFNGLALQPKIMLGMAMSGISYESSDLGGFAGPATTSELYTRWLQFGAFNGIMRAHTAQNDPEPWRFGSSTQKIVTDYINLRYSLFPYFYTLAHKYSLLGEPIVRPLVYDYPDDPNVLNMSDQFLLGSDILVVPVLESGAAKRSFYLPNGKWRIQTNSGSYEKGFYNWSVGIDGILYFYREGSIIPKAAVKRNLAENTLDTLILTVFRDESGSASGMMYEDDGESLQYKDGINVTSYFSAYQQYNGVDTVDYILNIVHNGQPYENSPTSRTFIMNFPNRDYESRAVTVNGDTAVFCSNEVEWTNHSGHAYYHKMISSDFSEIILKTTLPLLTDINVKVASRVHPVSVNHEKKLSFSLHQNYPNPFNPVTVISYELSAAGNVSLRVYDVLGREVRTVVNENQQPGTYRLDFDATDLSSGIYFVTLKSNEGVRTIRMTVLR